jgi:hypothetical protein
MIPLIKKTRNGDENDGSGEVGVEEGVKDKDPNGEGFDQDDGAGYEKNGNNDSPPPPPPSRAFNKCDCAQEINCTELAPLMFQKNECVNLDHHLCQSELEQREGHVDNVFTTQITLIKTRHRPMMTTKELRG